MTAGFETDLLYGVADLIADNTAFVWRPAGPAYAEDEVGIALRQILDAPDTIITLSTYTVADPPGISDVTIGVQLRARGPVGNVTVPGDIADACYELLHGLEKVTLNGISVVQMYRQSAPPLGWDPQGRWETAQNFYVDAMRPTVHNRE